MSIFGDPTADVVISQQTWVNITAEAEKLAAMAKECAAERQALRDKNATLRARVAELERAADNVIRCNTFGCAFPHPSFCPAQCQADQALRATLNGTADPEGAQRNGD